VNWIRQPAKLGPLGDSREILLKDHIMGRFVMGCVLGRQDKIRNPL